MSCIKQMLFFIGLLLFISQNILALEAAFLKPSERQWISKHPTIKACVETDWAPFSYISGEGKIVGLSKDYSDELAKNVGLHIAYIPYGKWEDILKDVKSGKCDLLNGLYYTKERAKYLYYTAPYLQMKEYFFVRDDSAPVHTMKDLMHKKVALVQGYAVTEWVKKHYPSIEVIEKKSITECLYSVSIGESDAFIGDSPSARYHLEEHFITNIYMSNINVDREPRELRMGVKKEYFILANILNKSIKHLSEAKQKVIRKRWMNESQEKTNWLLIGSIFAFILFVTFVITLFNLRLRKLVREKTAALEKLNHELEDKVEARTKELTHLNDKLLLAANTDPMTGIYNRRYFFDVSQQILAISKKENTPISIAMLDIDKFKNINDTYGHDIGDKVIKKSVEIIRQNLKRDDILIRFGGEEFLIVMLDTSLDDAYDLCEAIRKNMEEGYPIDPKTKVTLSIGISEFRIEDKDIDSIVKRADNALYRAKRTGRNKIIVE